MNSRFGALVSRMRTQRALSTLVILLTLTVGILIGTVLSRGRVRGYLAPDGSLLPAMQITTATEQHLRTGGHGG